MKKIMPALCLAILSACTTPADVSKPLTAGGDKNAKFDIKQTAGGFTVDLRYSRYQFIPEAGALLTACRSIIIARVEEEAKVRGRAIKPIDEQAVRVSVGRNILSGRTACRAFVEAVWNS